MLTAFIPFHDCGEEMGTITMVDGSHRWKEIGGRRHHQPRTSPSATAANWRRCWRRTPRFNGVEVRKVPMNIPKGHISFHHCRTYHGSGAEPQRPPRRAISLHLQDGENRYREFRRSDGSQVAYNHDVLVRRTAAGTPDYSDPEYLPLLWSSR